jgi:hypothetical protein
VPGGWTLIGVVHEEADGSAVHAEDRPTELEVLVDGVEEQAVTAELDTTQAMRGVAATHDMSPHDAGSPGRW